jgi:hypothetical protein
MCAFLAAGLLAAARAVGPPGPVTLRQWPFLFLAGAFGLGLVARFPGELRRVARVYRERFAPPGTGEKEDTLPDHYRFLEALAPRVRPEERILAITDRYPYPDLAYWFLPPRPGGPVVERVDPKLERVAAYLGEDPARPGFAPLFATWRGTFLRGAGLLFEPGELPGLLANADVLIALDTELDLRAPALDAGLTESLLPWSARKYALRRPLPPR